MEARKVVIVESGGQVKKTIVTSAETLGQLKEDLAANNINYEGKTFFEGLSKTELRQDDSLLPRDIPRNGSTTNNLVFMLTTPQKLIKSGYMSRQEAYAKIKELGLQGEVMARYGKNFTMCKTEELIKLIDEQVESEESEYADNGCECEEKGNRVEVLEAALRELIDRLYYNDAIGREDMIDILEMLSESTNENSDCPYTDDEVKDIIAGLDI